MELLDDDNSSDDAASVDYRELRDRDQGLLSAASFKDADFTPVSGESGRSRGAGDRSFGADNLFQSDGAGDLHGLGAAGGQHPSSALSGGDTNHLQLTPASGGGDSWGNLGAASRDRSGSAPAGAENWSGEGARGGARGPGVVGEEGYDAARGGGYDGSSREPRKGRAGEKKPGATAFLAAGSRSLRALKGAFGYGGGSATGAAGDDGMRRSTAFEQELPPNGALNAAALAHQREDPWMNGAFPVADRTVLNGSAGAPVGGGAGGPGSGAGSGTAGAGGPAGADRGAALEAPPGADGGQLYHMQRGVTPGSAAVDHSGAEDTDPHLPRLPPGSSPSKLKTSATKTYQTEREREFARSRRDRVATLSAEKQQIYYNYRAGVAVPLPGDDALSDEEDGAPAFHKIPVESLPAPTAGRTRRNSGSRADQVPGSRTAGASDRGEQDFGPSWEQQRDLRSSSIEQDYVLDRDLPPGSVGGSPPDVENTQRLIEELTKLRNSLEEEKQNARRAEEEKQIAERRYKRAQTAAVQLHDRLRKSRDGRKHTTAAATSREGADGGPALVSGAVGGPPGAGTSGAGAGAAPGTPANMAFFPPPSTPQTQYATTSAQYAATGGAAVDSPNNRLTAGNLQTLGRTTSSASSPSSHRARSEDDGGKRGRSPPRPRGMAVNQQHAVINQQPLLQQPTFGGGGGGPWAAGSSNVGSESQI